MIGMLALALFAVCAAAPAADPNTADHPPADIKSDKRVRCLVDTPDGCTGCDQGSSCVYQELPEYDCVYIVYGTKCEDAPKQ